MMMMMIVIMVMVVMTPWESLDKAGLTSSQSK